MILYLSIIIASNILISGLNIAYGISIWGSPWLIIVATLICTAFQFLVDGIFAIAVNILPNKWFPLSKFNVSKTEKNFYEKLKIRSWKNSIWELGGLGGFKKNKLAEPNNPEYIKAFIIECNKGSITHIIGLFVGFLDIFILPFEYALIISVPVAIVNFFLNLLPIMVLRYNTYKLKFLYKKLIKNQNNSQEKNAI